MEIRRNFLAILVAMPLILGCAERSNSCISDKPQRAEIFLRSPSKTLNQDELTLLKKIYQHSTNDEKKNLYFVKAVSNNTCEKVFGIYVNQPNPPGLLHLQLPLINYNGRLLYDTRLEKIFVAPI